MNNFLHIGVLLLYIIGLLMIFAAREKRNIPVVLILSTIILACIVNMLYFNTDAEDTYIALRYVKNYIHTGQWVFNSFDRVEGYSDFLWLLCIAYIHKITLIDIPLVARLCGLFFTILSVIYLFYLTKKITHNDFVSFMAALFLSINGSFSCYALSGLENPLFGFLLLSIIHAAFLRLWWLCGLLVALLFMTRPEGVLMYFPLFIYIFTQEESLSSKINKCAKSFAASMVFILPWFFWKYNFYGYIVPNSLAAKMGMNPLYQIRIGIFYSIRFLFANQLLLIILFFLLSFIGISIRKFKSYFGQSGISKFIICLLVMYFMFYSYSGGDWMPGYRFYASIMPVIFLFLFILWDEIEKKYFIQFQFNKLFIFFFIVVGFLHINTNQDIFRNVRAWDHEVQGLKYIGKWFKKSLPDTTVVATFPNGAFSYYNELPTLDVAGLTDNMTGRFGVKQKFGRPGHISSNWPYILNKRPQIIAQMGGSGFESSISNKKMNGYNAVSFYFKNYNNKLGKYVNLLIRSDIADDIITKLSVKNEIEVVFNEKG
jgi:hypothetical protein